MLGKQTCSFLENILALITFGSLLFISLLIDIKGVVKSVGFAWSGGLDSLKLAGLYPNIDLI